MSYPTYSHNLRRTLAATAALFVVLLIAVVAARHTPLVRAQTADTTDTTATGQTTSDTNGTTGDSTTPADAAADSGTAGADGTSGTDGTPTDTSDNAVATSDTSTDGTATNDTATTNTPSDISTGDATSSLDATTQANTNDTTVDTPAGADTTVANTNSATSSTTAAVTSATGDNAASGTAGASITTGSANASANVVNVINTNVFNAQGLIYFLNLLTGTMQLDLRNLFSVLTGGDPGVSGCTLDSCGGDTTLTISNQNAATIDNNVTVGATTGGNAASSTDGTSTIATGDANASANVVNVVNTNITGANYLLLAVNDFSKLAGDIVFPGADWFRDLLSSGTGVSAGSQTTITNTNAATTTNAVDVTASTGDNTASGDNATISTGNASAGATVVNQVNTNVFGNSLLLLFRIHGTWSGNVFGLPDGMTWSDTSDGVELMLDPNAASPSASSLPVGSTDRLSVTNTNTANVTNNVSVYALTGDNKATSTDGSATVTTGDAYASANVVNVVNSNILGRNWVLAIFNIFGDWNGNISFGQPDLWVGARAIVPSVVRSGSCFNYEVTINNLGDAAATNVRLSSVFDRTQEDFQQFDRDLGDRLAWDIGRIEAHGTRVVTLPVCVSHFVGQKTNVETDFTATGNETDADLANNTDTIGVVTIPGGGGSALRLGPADLAITKSVSTSTITASSSVNYEITIANTGDPVYNTLLIDTIYGPDGEPIHEQRWGLDTIKNNETVIVRYTAFFKASSTPGTYRNEAFISGTQGNPDYEHNLGSPVDSPVASADVEITAPGDMITAVADTPQVCTPLLTTYIRYGADNDRGDVEKLQYFLKTVEHEDAVTLTGVYDAPTRDAVRDLQRRYAADILTPWGLTKTTGYVYYTTQKKINELWCTDRAFPLTAAQEAEIEHFKAQAEAYRAAGTEVPETMRNEVGMAPSDHGSALATAALTNREEHGDLAEPTTADHKNADRTNNSQLAAAGAALKASAAQSIWSTVRDRFAGLWSWIGR